MSLKFYDEIKLMPNNKPNVIDVIIHVLRNSKENYHLRRNLRFYSDTYRTVADNIVNDPPKVSAASDRYTVGITAIATSVSVMVVLVIALYLCSRNVSKIEAPQATTSQSSLSKATKQAGKLNLVEEEKIRVNVFKKRAVNMLNMKDSFTREHGSTIEHSHPIMPYQKDNTIESLKTLSSPQYVEDIPPQGKLLVQSRKENQV
ncbi:hypothetical protein SNEBB_000719 [Seison nebaliae]|nr:hypothetical protein SNEBB_000719 [Seison nebaliae]